MVALPLVFQTTEVAAIWGHPIQVALQIAIPEWMERLSRLFCRDGMEGKAIALQDRIEAVAQRALKWANCAANRNFRRKLRSPSSASPDKGNVGTAAYLDVFRSTR